MRVLKCGTIGALMAAAAACSGGTEADEPAAAARAGTSPAEERLTAAPAPAAVDWAQVEARVGARVDSVNRALLAVRPLTRTEQGSLRADGNAAQIARARALGVRAGSEYERLAESGRLVRLADNTEYWALHNLTHSVPYVTPDTEAMLAELGQRFQARLDSLGMPAFRLVVTSVLRTPEKQAALRRSNANASQGVSAHEFGTTIDVAYRRFGAPLDAEQLVPGADPHGVVLHDSLMVEMANLRGAELQAVLGRVLQEMRAEGKLLVMMERQQTVYHMTVARRYAERPSVAVVPVRPRPETASPATQATFSGTVETD